MDKEGIYRLIGYQGEYTDSVKKALRKLLKDNHPDRSGNEEIFKLVNEVKKELENNQVSFKYEKKEIKKFDDIDYDYCHTMINKLEIDKKNKLSDKKKIQERILFLSKEYHLKYRESIDKAQILLNKGDYQNKLNYIKKITIIITCILIILFIIAIIKKNIIVFTIFGFGCIITILFIEKYFTILKQIGKKSKQSVDIYIKILDEIKNINEEKDKLNLELVDINHQINNTENNLRFYKNLLK